MPAVTAVPVAPTAMLSLVLEFSSKPRRAPLTRVSAPVVLPSVSAWIAALFRLRLPAASMVIVLTPPRPNPATSLPSLTVTPAKPPLRVVVPVRVAVPGPVLMRLPAVLVMLAMVRLPSEFVTFTVPLLAPMTMGRFRALLMLPV